MESLQCAAERSTHHAAILGVNFDIEIPRLSLRGDFQAPTRYFNFRIGISSEKKTARLNLEGTNRVFPSGKRKKYGRPSSRSSRDLQRSHRLLTTSPAFKFAKPCDSTEKCSRFNLKRTKVFPVHFFGYVKKKTDVESKWKNYHIITFPG